MIDVDSFDLNTQIEFANVVKERDLYKLKYNHLCDLLNRVHDEAYQQDNTHVVIAVNLINSLQFQYCNKLDERLK